MGRELQKKKRRSGRMPIRQSNKTKKILNPRGNSIIAQNWDKKSTVTQNYRRLGLVSRLRTPTGGVEGPLAPSKTSSSSATPSSSTLPAPPPSLSTPFAIPSTEQLIVSEARVERDATTGRILRVLGRRGRENPLNDALRHLDSDSDEEEEEEEEEEKGQDEDTTTTDVVRELSRQASQNNTGPRPPRHPSQREADWLRRLVARHGPDVEAMARDSRLNPMQQTSADIARRLRNAGITLADN